MDDERTFTPSEILEYCSKKWFDNPAGISALDLAQHFQITNEAAMRIFELIIPAYFEPPVRC